MPLDVLVLDVGGSHVKLFESATNESRSFDSGDHFTPDMLLDSVNRLASDWNYSVVSIGVPGAVGPKGPTDDPPKLGPGWVGYDFEQAFERPVRIVNDAAMQALGAYGEGRMLFLGLGTGLGSAMVAERVIVPLELGSLAYDETSTLADRLSKAGLARYGRDMWQQTLERAVPFLRRAFSADSVVLGGGLADHVSPMPDAARRGGNADAFAGGVRLWDDWVEEHDVPRSHIWRVVW